MFADSDFKFVDLTLQICGPHPANLWGQLCKFEKGHTHTADTTVKLAVESRLHIPGTLASQSGLVRRPECHGARNVWVTLKSNFGLCDLPFRHKLALTNQIAFRVCPRGT